MLYQNTYIYTLSYVTGSPILTTPVLYMYTALLMYVDR